MSTPAVPSAAQQVFDEITAAQMAENGATVGRAFAGEGLKISGKLYAFFRRDRLIVKLPESRVDAIAAAGQGEHCETQPGRPMREWLATPLVADAADDAERWRSIVDEARAFVAAIESARRT